MNSTLVNETRLPLGHEGYRRLAGAVIRIRLSDPLWQDTEDGRWWIVITGLDPDYIRRMAKRHLQAEGA